MSSNAFRRVAPLIPLTALLALSFATTRSASANETADRCAIVHAHTTHAWTLAWRPNWLPGDPATDESVPTLLRASAWTPGLMIAIDPETKRPVTPTPEQRRAMSDAMERGGALGAPVSPDAPLRVEKIPSGGEVTYLDGRFQVYMVARRDANGHIVTDCVPGAEAAKQVVSHPAPASVKEDR